MMCCGQVWPLGTYLSFANRLTLEVAVRLTIRGSLFPLFTGCGLGFPAVDGLCPNPEESPDAMGMNRLPIFIP
jgi:hypothetical protein